MAGWDEGAKYMVQVMNIDNAQQNEGDDEEVEIENSTRDIEVEIQDADGRVSKMTISSDCS